VADDGTVYTDNRAKISVLEEEPLQCRHEKREDCRFTFVPLVSDVSPIVPKCKIRQVHVGGVV